MKNELKKERISLIFHFIINLWMWRLKYKYKCKFINTLNFSFHLSFKNCKVFILLFVSALVTVEFVFPLCYLTYNFVLSLFDHEFEMAYLKNIYI